MRRVIMVILTTIIYAMFFISCSNISNIKSTELNNIFIDNLNIGSSIQNINLKKYTESNRYSGDYMCKFEELIIDFIFNLCVWSKAIMLDIHNDNIFACM